MPCTLKSSAVERLQNIVLEQLGVEPERLTPAARLHEDLGADSLDALEIVIKLNELFGIDVPEETCEHFKTYGDLVRCVDPNAEVSHA